MGAHQVLEARFQVARAAQGVQMTVFCCPPQWGRRPPRRFWVWSGPALCPPVVVIRRGEPGQPETQPARSQDPGAALVLLAALRTARRRRDVRKTQPPRWPWPDGDGLICGDCARPAAGDWNGGGVSPRPQMAAFHRLQRSRGDGLFWPRRWVVPGPWCRCPPAALWRRPAL